MMRAYVPRSVRDCEHIQDQLAIIFVVESVDSYYQSLTRKGIEFVNVPQNQKDWGIRLAHFRDPAGNLIEINQGL